MSGVKHAHPEHPIHAYLSERWSPYAFADRPVSGDVLNSLFEAARWAPSSYNEQSWRYIVATKDDQAEFDRLLSCLVEGNQAWAKRAPVLAIGCVCTRFVKNGKPNPAAEHDLGLASANLTFEATSRGLYVHQMIGILPDRVRELYAVPAEALPLTGLAIGHLAPPEALPGRIRERDRSERSRRPLSETVFQGTWGTPGGHPLEQNGASA